MSLFFVIVNRTLSGDSVPHAAAGHRVWDVSVGGDGGMYEES